VANFKLLSRYSFAENHGKFQSLYTVPHPMFEQGTLFSGPILGRLAKLTCSVTRNGCPLINVSPHVTPRHKPGADNYISAVNTF
jgi:hypothetical protein